MDQELPLSSWRKEQHSTRSESKVEKKSSMHVASEIKAFGNRRNATDVVDSRFHDQQMKIVAATSNPGFGGFKEFAGLSNAFSVTKKKKREYREPWDYNFSYYPTTPPLRRPYSGNAEPLDKAESENAVEYDEMKLHSASDLGLLDQGNAPKMLFLQLPATLPSCNRQTSEKVNTTVDRTKARSMTNRKEAARTHVPPKALSAAFKGTKIAGSPANHVEMHSSQRFCCSEELPKGYLGKMVVYKSGDVKLKLGEFLYDVSPGSDCVFPQSVVAINTITKYCVQVAELKKRAVVSPDIDSLVDNVIDFR